MTTLRQIARNWVRLLSVGLCAAVLGGCGSHAKPTLLDAKPQASADLDAEHQRKHDMQAVHVIDATTGAESEMEIGDFTDLIGTVCFGSSRDASCTDSGGGTCANALCTAMEYLCFGHFFFETAGITNAPVKLGNVLVPAQSAATNSTLFKYAIQNTILSMKNDTAHELKRIASGNDLDCATRLAGSRTYAGALTATYVEAYELGRDMYDKVSDQTLAVADAELSTTPSLTTAIARAFAANDLSRSAAAHWLVGGDPAFLGSETQALCSGADLSPQGRAALAILRQAAVAPDDVQSASLQTENLLTGTLINGSIRQRLAELWDTPSPGVAPDIITNTTDPTAFAKLFGLNVSDFVEARTYMSQEIHAFGRSATATLPPRALVGGRTSSFPIYAATARDPEPVAPAYYGALARYVGPPSGAADLSPELSNFDFFVNSLQFYGLAQFVDGTVSAAADIIATTNDFTVPDATARSELITPLALMVEDGQRDRLGRWEIDLSPPSDGFVFLTTYTDGFAENEGLRIVLGEDGLRCATTGTIEGAPCDPRATTVLNIVSPISPLAGFNHSSWGQIWIPYDANFKGNRLYLLRPRAGRASNGCTPDPSQPTIKDYCPGDFEALAGSVVGKAANFDSFGETRFVSVVPEADKRAAKIIEPDPRWCSRSNTSCAGEDFNARLPLEDELSDDNDGVESSWKHYLALARQSATESDALGEEVIRLGLDMDLRSEQAQEQLQDICGTSVDSSVMASALSAPGTKDLGGVVDGRACSFDGECDADQSCAGGKCAVDPLLLAKENTENAEFTRLAECLGDDTVVKFVTPGKRYLCIWQATDNKYQVCQGATSTMQCPVVAERDSADPSVACPPDYFKTPTGTTPLVVKDTLGYFDNTTTEQPGGGARLDEVCDAVRVLRANRQSANPDSALSATLVGKIKGSDFYHPDHLAELAPKIGWEARFGGYSAITVNGVALFQTGDVFTKPAMLADGSDTADGWPCKTQQATNCNVGSGLFCSTAQCRTEASRAEINDRMARAVIALRETTVPYTGYNLWDGVRLPFTVKLGTGNLGLSYTEYSTRTRQSPFGATVAISSGTMMPAYISGIQQPNVDIDVYIPDGPDSGRLAWLMPRAEGDSSSATRILGSAAYPPLALFAIGAIHIDVPPKPYTNVSPFFWWSGLSQSQLYHHTWPLDNDEFGHMAWYYGVLSGTRSPLDKGRYTRQALPWLHGFSDGVLDPTEQIGTGLLSDFTYSERSMLDGMELLCEVGRIKQAPLSVTQPPRVQSAEDLERANGYLHLVADELMSRRGTIVFANMPVRAVDALRNESSSGAYPALGGKYGAAVARLRAALVQLSEIAPNIAAELRSLGDDMNQMRLAVERGQISSDMADVKFYSTVSDQLAACASSAEFSPTGPFKALATCANSVAQIHFAGAIKDLTQADTVVAQQEAVNQFDTSFAHHSQTLQNLGTSASQQIEEIDAALADLETLRSEGRRALAKALFLDSDQAGQQFAVNTVMRRHYNIARIRYEEAHKNAVRMAFLAKRAIELRLGMRLSDMHDDLPLVAAPATWESTVCASTGIDYTKLRDAGLTSSSDGATGTNELAVLGKFADQYIGTYVNRLENVVESYRLVNNFHEGSDTAVVSLRDDVQNVRAVCDTPVGNLLYQAGQLDQHADQNAGVAGWELAGCPLQNVNGVVSFVPNCVGAYPLNDANASPFAGANADLAAVRGYTVAFGPMGTGLTCNPATCGERAPSALVQRVNVKAGSYRLSWYGRPTVGATNGLNPAEAVTVRALGDREVPPIDLNQGLCPNPDLPWEFFAPALCVNIFGDSNYCAGGVSTVPGLQPCAPTQVCQGTQCVTSPVQLGSIDEAPSANGWARYVRTFSVPQSMEIAVAIERDFNAAVVPQQVDLAAFMLEPKPSDPNASSAPSMFTNTSDTLTRPLATCEDTTGAVFRSNGSWHRDCVRLCPDGLTNDCVLSNAQTYCFRETEFNINQRDIEAGKILGSSGFARGNFNYRIESLGVNFVGNGIRDCSTSDTPTACHGAGFATYTIEHRGPYYVRNHMGQDFPADLFVGSIEHGRGLANESYVTNPISSADQNLLSQYMRNELRGRPLDGHFVLRVWEEPGVNFDAIQDVQLVIKYRYWTRFD